MWFSATASFPAGALLLGIGTPTLKSSRRPCELPLAAIPLLFALRQLRHSRNSSRRKVNARVRCRHRDVCRRLWFHSLASCGVGRISQDLAKVLRTIKSGRTHPPKTDQTGSVGLRLREDPPLNG